MERSRANGPGVRAVLWTQGCSLGCAGCFNPETHTFAGGSEHSAEDLLDRLTALGDAIEGVTFSGGEPLQQPEPLLAVLRLLRERTALSVLVFSGYRIDEIRALRRGPAILALIDVLVAGRYDRDRHEGRGLLGSANQHIHLLTDRYSEEDLRAVPEAEVQILPDGRVIVSGVEVDGLSPQD